MQVNITFRHLESTEALKSYAREKVEHIQKFIDRPGEARAAYARALELVHSEPERRFLEQRLAELEA